MPLTISKVAAEAGVNVQTLRYYERCGILPEPARTPAGYRQYEQEAVTRIRFIKRAQELGFTLKEVSELLDLRVEHDAACTAIEAKACAKRDLVDEKIRLLTGLRDVLDGLVDACRRREKTEDCPILEGLEKGPRGTNGGER
ncbi:MAG: MerR family transcriptional regulator [Gemmatimonadota bacterium]